MRFTYTEPLGLKEDDILVLIVFVRKTNCYKLNPWYNVILVSEIHS